MLTKSDYLIGLQCPKYLWVKKHEPEKLPEHDLMTQHRFKQGELVGEIAQRLFPEGIDLPSDFKKNLKETERALKKRKVLFEAGIQSGDLYSRADILVPVNEEEWDVIEVKSSTRVKEQHLMDVSFQKYVYENFGLKIRKCFVMVVDNSYVKRGKMEPEKFLKKKEVTKELDLEEVGKNVPRMFKILAKEEAPEFQLEDIEKSFYDNPFTDEFFDSLEMGSVFELYRGGKKCVELFGEEICLLKEIPEEYELTKHQEVQRECAKTREAYVDKKKLKKFLDKLEEPIYYLDFEAFNSAVPVYDETGPYQQIPFQYSLHVVRDGSQEHHSFLFEGGEDEREKLLKSLMEKLGEKGSIVVYNASFEKRILKELGKTFDVKVKGVLKRIVDLIVPFRNFYYYNPKQQGSASLKDVLPALLGKNPYKELEINNGELASLSFMNISFGDADEEEVKKVREELEKYCGLDTEAMIWIVDELEKLVEKL